jgi:hypothetical protein
LHYFFYSYWFIPKRKKEYTSPIKKNKRRRDKVHTKSDSPVARKTRAQTEVESLLQKGRGKQLVQHRRRLLRHGIQQKVKKRTIAVTAVIILITPKVTLLMWIRPEVGWKVCHRRGQEKQLGWHKRRIFMHGFHKEIKKRTIVASSESSSTSSIVNENKSSKKSCHQK